MEITDDGFLWEKNHQLDFQAIKQINIPNNFEWENKKHYIWKMLWMTKDFESLVYTQLNWFYTIKKPFDGLLIDNVYFDTKLITKWK